MSVSIRRRLLIRLISAIVFTWAIAIVFVYYATYHEVEEVYDASLAQQARVLATLMRHQSKTQALIQHNLQELLEETDIDLRRPSLSVSRLLERRADQDDEQAFLNLIDQRHLPGHRYESKIAFTVTDAGDKVVLRSNIPFKFDRFTTGFDERELGGVRWRTFGLMEPVSQLRVQVGEKLTIRQELVEYIMLSTLWPLFAGLPFIALVIWVTVGSGLRPLKQVALKVERRDPNSLVPISHDGVPDEVVPMVESLNRLFTRVQNALDNERHFTTNAAHELRTPLSALKAMAQAKQLSLQHEENPEHQRFLQQIVSGVDRTSHLLEQLLTLARMESQSMSMRDLQQVDLAEQVLTVLSEIGQQALDRDIDLSFEGEPQGVLVEGYGPALQILIRNLIDNAIRYTPQGGWVRITVSRESTDACLTVEDSGPGIPDEQMSRMFQRFQRGEHQDVEGSGLGLSIVQRIIELHHGWIELSNLGAEGGLRIRVTLEMAD